MMISLLGYITGMPSTFVFPKLPLTTYTPYAYHMYHREVLSIILLFANKRSLHVRSQGVKIPTLIGENKKKINYPPLAL